MIVKVNLLVNIAGNAQKKTEISDTKKICIQYQENKETTNTKNKNIRIKKIINFICNVKKYN